MSHFAQATPRSRCIPDARPLACPRRRRAAEAPGKGKAGEEEGPSSTAVINYTYFDSSRKDGLLPAAKRRPTLSAADAVQMQQDAAAASGSGGGKK